MAIWEAFNADNPFSEIYKPIMGAEKRKKWGKTYKYTKFLSGAEKLHFVFSKYEVTWYKLPLKSDITPLQAKVTFAVDIARNQGRISQKLSFFKRIWGRAWRYAMLHCIQRSKRQIFKSHSPILTQIVNEKVSTDVEVEGQLTDIAIPSRLVLWFGHCFLIRNKYLYKKALDLKTLHTTSKRNNRKDFMDVVDR